MSITVMTRGAVASQDSRREVFTPDARKILEKNYKSRKFILEGGKATAMGGGEYRVLDRIQDPQEMAKQMRQYEKNYEKGAPIKLEPATENALWKKAKVLKDQFTVGMLPKRELHPVKLKQIIKNGRAVEATVVDNDILRTNKVVERNKTWYKANGDKIREFKRIMRILQPHVPKIDIERYRPN